jgi:hypothetical protein
LFHLVVGEVCVKWKRTHQKPKEKANQLDEISQLARARASTTNGNFSPLFLILSDFSALCHLLLLFVSFDRDDDDDLAAISSSLHRLDSIFIFFFF